MSIWETIKSWFKGKSKKVSLEDVLNRPAEIAENDLVEILNKAKEGDVENELLAGVLYLKGARIPQDVSKAVEYLDKSAQASNVSAQKILAKEYMAGTSIPQDLKQAFDWFQKAAYSGDIESMHNLGVMYEEGIAVEKDISKAIECFQKASDLGYAEAKVEIADIYYEGADLPMDRTKACAMYKEILAVNSSTIDVGRICMCLGQAYADKFIPCGLTKGEGLTFLQKAIEKEYYEAVEVFALLGEELDEGYRKWLFEFSAQRQDNPYCAFAMGVCYEKGYGTFQDKNSAFNYYKKSAEMGDPWGMHYTAQAYLNGHGVEKSVDEWLRLETQAADEGVLPAQYSLGVCYLKGDHVEKNQEQAKRLLKLAADRHYGEAEKVLKEIQDSETSKNNVSLPTSVQEQKNQDQRNNAADASSQVNIQAQNNEHEFNSQNANASVQNHVQTQQIDQKSEHQSVLPQERSLIEKSGQSQPEHQGDPHI